MKYSFEASPANTNILECYTHQDTRPPSWALLQIDLQALQKTEVKAVTSIYIELTLQDPVPYKTTFSLSSVSQLKSNILFKLPALKDLIRVQIFGLPSTIFVSSVKIKRLSKFAAAGRILLPKIKKLLFNPLFFFHFLKEILYLGCHGGFRAIKQKIGSLVLSNQTRENYAAWIRAYDQLTDSDKAGITRRVSELPYQPLISIVMPTYNVEERWLRLAIQSVRNQLYTKWELCIADDHSTQPHVRAVLEEYKNLDSRIKVIYRAQNGHISEASNSALELATGDFTALLDNDDELREHALYFIVEELNKHPDADLIYSDEDKLDLQGVRFDPHFKSDWNPDLFYSFNLVTHLSVFRTTLLKAIGGFRKGYEGSQDYDLVCRFIEKTTPSRIRHIPHILYHWRAIPGSTALRPKEKDYAILAARSAIADHLKRKGIQAHVTGGYGPLHRVIYALPSVLPKVSIIICTRDRLQLLRTIVHGVLEKTSYPATQLELIIVNNQSSEQKTLKYFQVISKDPRVRVIDYDQPFNFSAMNNFAAQRSTGEILTFLNNDTKVISPNWLQEMVSHSLRDEIGAVGAKLYFQDDTIQHAGIILGVNNTAGHAHIGFSKFSPGYLGRAVCIQSYSAVTAACMTLRKKIFEEVGGFDEINLPIAYNDVDICLRIQERGYRILWTPYAELYHLESASRGSDLSEENKVRFYREMSYLQTRWKDKLNSDPYYNPNLSTIRPDFTPAFPPKTEKPWKNPP